MADVVDLIEKDHREVESMFAEFTSTSDPQIATRICEELTKHTNGEERAVYPTFAERLSGGKQLSVEAVDEHKEARQLIGRIRNTTDPEHLAELMAELEEAVQHHVEEEETEMLPKARREMPAAELTELGRKFEQAKETVGQQSA